MKEIFEEIIKEANIGKIVIDGDEFPIAFNTLIYEDGQKIYSDRIYDEIPTLVIKNQTLFYTKITEYVSLYLNSSRKLPKFIHDIDKNNIKLIMSYLFANATTEDFLNPISLIERNIKFLNDDTFSNLNDTMNTKELNSFMNSNLEITRTSQSVFMETPYKIDIKFTNYFGEEKVYYNLPSISYGIILENGEKVCYVYSILNPKEKNNKTNNQNKYEKKIAREMYKLNAGVREQESEEYKNYINGESSYYPENISDVSPSAIISLTVFLSLLEKENIKEIKVVPYLPLRYLSRELSLREINDSAKVEELKARNNYLQQNITDKFIRTFRRVNYHFPSLEINRYPYELDEYMGVSLSLEESKFNNQILEEIYTNVNTNINKRFR